MGNLKQRAVVKGAVLQSDIEMVLHPGQTQEPERQLMCVRPERVPASKKKLAAFVCHASLSLNNKTPLLYKSTF